MSSRDSATDPRRNEDRRQAHRSALDALIAISEAATFSLLAEHHQLLLRAPDPSPLPSRDIDEEAQHLLDLLEQIHVVVRRYVAIAEPDDDLPF